MIDENTLKEVINSMTDGFDKETMSSELYKHFLNNLKWFENPEDLHVMILYPVEKTARLIIQKGHNKSSEVAEIWLNYDFIENNISRLCKKFYGSGCSVDRGRFITNSFIKVKETGDMPQFNWKQEYTYHYPETGTMEQWINFAEGVYELKYGRNEKYLIALNELIDAHRNRAKQEETSHTSEGKD